MHRALHPVMRPLMRTWHHNIIEALATMPRAHDAPKTHASGLDPDHILIFGNGLATGWGVASHDLALPGELARALSTATGRGADVDVSVYSDLKIAGAYQFIGQLDLSGYDGIVVIIGASDALSLTPRTQWQASMRALIETLLKCTAASTRITVIEQSPIRPVPPFNSLFGRVANSYSTVLNTITRGVCAEYSRADYVSLPPAHSPAAERLGTPGRYKEWGQFIALQLAPQLNEATGSPAGREGA